MKAARILLTLIAATVSIVAIFCAAVYGFGADNPYTRVFNRNFPFLPAAMVNGKFVFLADMEKRLLMYESAVNYQSRADAMDLRNSRSEIMDALIGQEITADIAAKKKLEVAQGQLDEYFRHVTNNFDGNFQGVFGVSADVFKNQIVRPDLLEKNVQATLYADDADSKQYQRARKIKELLNDGLEFSVAVQSYSEDEKSKYISGDLGFKTADELGPWLAKSALSLQGTTTSEVIVSPEGYHIIRVTSRDTSSIPAKYQVQQILIRGFDFEEYLEKQRKNYRIYTFGKYD